MGANSAVGQYGENVAAGFLLDRGYELLDRNWRCEIGELDIVARTADGVLVFVEVKCRSGLGYGQPVDAVTPVKAQRIRRLAYCWLETHPTRRRGVRFDVISVLRQRRAAAQVEHFQDAF
jgi:putative endonuclease